MGIGFVFLIYLVVLSVLTVPAMAVCVGIGYWLTRKSTKRVKNIFIIGGVLLPITGAIYLVAIIIIMAIVGLATGHDAGFGDGFDIPLHNHYHWSAIDTTDSAEVYDEHDKSATDGEGDTHIEPDNRDAFSNVVEFQEDGDWITGACDSHDGRFDHPPSKEMPDHWFLFNTRTHSRFDARSEDELRSEAAAQGIALHLQSSDEFYASHHLGWLDLIIGVLLLILPVTVLVFLWRRGRRLLHSVQ